MCGAKSRVEGVDHARASSISASHEVERVLLSKPWMSSAAEV